MSEATPQETGAPATAAPDRIGPAPTRPTPRPSGVAGAPATFVPAAALPVAVPARPPVLPLSDEGLDELVSSGRMSEGRMLDIAAAQMGLQRVSLALTPPAPDLAQILPPQLCLRHALAPWRRDGGTLLVATARPATARALDRILPTQLQPAHAVLAPLSEVQGHVARQHRTVLTAAMAARPRPEHSFRDYTASRRLRFGLAAGCLAATVALTVAPAALLAVLLWLAVLTLGMAMMLKLVSGVAQLGHARRAARRPPVAEPEVQDLPVISILVPLYRERRIAGSLVQRLRALDYPRGRLEVLMVLEETDETTAAALAEAELPPWIRTVTVPDGHPRTKPRAMNYALDFCRGEIIGIYDAEDAPDPDQLMKVAAAFADAPPDLACLQGALDYYNPRRNWLSRCFTIEYATWFRLILPGMARLGFAIPLGGTTLFVRRHALEAVGAWDAHNVTEDADLGLRLARHGWRTEVIDSTTREEANCRPGPWVRQRSRWLKGYMVTYLVNMRRPLTLWREMGSWRFLGFQLHFVTALSQVLLGPLLLSVWLLALGLGHPAREALAPDTLRAMALFFVASEMLNLALYAIATRGPDHRHLWPWCLTMMAYFPLAYLAAYKALYELLAAPFYWDKTCHGVSPPDTRPEDGSAGL